MTTSTNSKRLQKHLVLLTLAITLGIGLSFSVIASALYQQYLERALIHSTSTNLRFLTDSIEHNLEDVYSLVRWTQTNTAIGKYIATDDEGTYASNAISAYERLTEEVQNRKVGDYLHRIVIANAHGRYIQNISAKYSSGRNLASLIPQEPYFDTLVNDRGFRLSTGFMSDPFYDGTTPQIVPLLRPIYATFDSSEAGFVYIAINESLFTSTLQYYDTYEDAALYLILEDHTYLMHPDGLVPLSVDALYSPEDRIVDKRQEASVYAYRVDDRDGEETVYVVRPLSTVGCYVVQELSRSELSSNTRLLIYFWLIVVTLMSLVGLALTYALHRLIGLPVQRIQRQIARVSSGDFTPDHSIERNDELGDIGRGVNTMAADIEQLMERRIFDEKEKKDLEYKVLQNQINPHFLYNTLNSIKWMASVQGAEGIANMTTSLSRLLRSISKGTDLHIPISEELSLIRDYFNIQNYRYGGTIQLNINCDDSRLMQCQIIKFTLQPIVENAIFHGLEPKGGTGAITITIHEAPGSARGDIEIIIHDNGVGIPEEKIKTLLTQNSNAGQELFKEIGISNVHKRLRYEYGDDYGIHIESIVGEYTAAHIVLPRKESNV
ncbi:MAG: sensor histidine kinase [Lachnospiraceae bacterium]|nr:sensor histidine kinase [Lachnospiraceae bacterium]